MYDCNPLYKYISLDERKEMTKLNKKLTIYVADIDQQRKDLKDAKIRKDDIEKYVFHSLSPTNEEYFRLDALQVKVWGA